MKSKTALAAGVVSSCLIVGYAIVGCSDNDSDGAPTAVDSGTDAKVALDTGTITVDPPDCVHCAGAKPTCVTRASLCADNKTSNGKSSQSVGYDLFLCIGSQCKTDCATAVAGQGYTDACLGCASVNCAALLTACLTDLDTDPACNISLDAGTDASEPGAGEDAGEDGGSDAGDDAGDAGEDAAP